MENYNYHCMLKIDEPKRIIIIGAGISGLSAGIYGQKNGYITEIFEKNPIHGGLCFTWFRDGFPIDGCIHWMTGTRKGTEMNSMWEELGAFTQHDVIRTDNFGSVECDGHVITFWCDLNRLQRELLDISPKDKRLINRFIRMIYRIQNMPLPTDIPLSAMSLKRKIRFVRRMIPYLRTYTFTKNQSQADFANSFKSPILAYAMEHIVPGNGNLYTALYAFGTVALGNGGVIKGGSMNLSNNLARTYRQKGGVIHYNSPVEEIVFEGKNIVGVKLKNGEIRKADYIVSACDVVETYKLLKGRCTQRQFQKRFKRPDIYPIPSCIYVSLKVDYEAFKKLCISSIYEFGCEEFLAGNRVTHTIKIHAYDYDKFFIRDGYVLMTVLLHQTNSDFAYWNGLRQNMKEYMQEKQRVGNEVVKRIEKHFPDLRDKMKVIDITTPITYNRYVNAFHGAYMPFAFTSKGSIYYSNGKIKGANNLMLATQWTVLPGGLPIAMMSGKFAIQRLLKKDQRWYKITKPIRFIYERKK